MSPEAFAERCRRILADHRGHARHRAFDEACEDALRAAGYGEGVAIFERAVRNWHGPGHPYPHQGPCPDCEAIPTLSPADPQDPPLLNAGSALPDPPQRAHDDRATP